MANVYNFNFKSEDGLSHRALNRLQFNMAGDTQAGLLATALSASGVMGARLASVMCELLRQNTGTTHPEGSRVTAKIFLHDSAGAVSTIRLRNVKTTVVPSDIAGVFVGNAKLPGGADIASVDVLMKTLPGSDT